MLPTHLLLGLVAGAFVARPAHVVGAAVCGIVVSTTWGVLLVVTDVGGAASSLGGTLSALTNFTVGALVGILGRVAAGSARRRRA